MISDPNAKDPQQMLTKSKRDEYLSSIRKKKSKQILLQKRAKYYTNEQLMTSQQMSNEDMLKAHYNQENEIEQREISQETKDLLTNAVKVFYQYLYSKDWMEVTNVIRQIREQIGQDVNQIPVSYIIDTGMVPDVLTLLGQEFAEYTGLQIQAAWFIANVSAGNSKDVSDLYQLNAIEILYSCMERRGKHDLHENAMWALANIAGESEKIYRTTMIEIGVLKTIKNEQFRVTKRVLYERTAAWLVANLVRGPDFPDYDKTSCIIITLFYLLKSTDTLTQEHSISALQSLSEQSDPAAITVISSLDFIPIIVSLISSQNDIIQKNAIKCVGNLAYGNDKITRKLAESDIFRTLPIVLNHENRDLRAEACFALSNILADSFDDHDYVLEHNLMPLICNILKNDEFDIRIHATYCIRNFMKLCSDDDANKVIEKDVLTFLVFNLNTENYKLTISSLQALIAILDRGEKMKDDNNNLNPYSMYIVNKGHESYIEQLQEVKDDTINNLVGQVIDNYFSYQEIIGER